MTTEIKQVTQKNESRQQSHTTQRSQRQITTPRFKVVQQSRPMSTI